MVYHQKTVDVRETLSTQKMRGEREMEALASGAVRMLTEKENFRYFQ